MRSHLHLYGMWVTLLTLLSPPIANTTFDAALAFYKALKVYPSPGDLIGIYDQTVSKVTFIPP